MFTGSSVIVSEASRPGEAGGAAGLGRLSLCQRTGTGWGCRQFWVAGWTGTGPARTAGLQNRTPLNRTTEQTLCSLLNIHFT